MILFLFSYIVCLLTLEEARRVERASGEEEILIFCKSQGKGFCLAAKHGRENKIELRLMMVCQVGDEAARWVRLEENMFQNVKYLTCIHAEVTREGFISNKLDLVPCDNQNAYQKFKCDSFCRVTIKPSAASGTYTLDYEELMINYISYAIPFLRLGIGHHGDRKWVIFQKNRGKSNRCICDARVVVRDAIKSSIKTIKGGRVVGKPCVFPFIYKGKDVWQCLEKNNMHMCSTVRNLDQNLNKWGICPSSKRGTFSNWLSPGKCDKPCGGGRLYKHRKCLFPPCVGHYVGIQQESCNVQKCTGDKILTIGGQSASYPTEGVLDVINYGPISSCSFPFVLDGERVDTCIRDHRRNHPWCSLTNNFDRHRKWGYCVNETKGVWSSWLSLDKAECSKTCGGGFLIQTRICRQPPCTGNSKLPSKKCNTEPCPECFDGDSGSYRGKKNVANDGTPCKYWSSLSVDQYPDDDPKRFPELEQNFCRNPEGKERLTYCYRDDPKKLYPAKMFCDVIPCSMKTGDHDIPYTIPFTSEGDDDPLELNCSFPVRVDFVWYDFCVQPDSRASGLECRVEGRQRNINRYCPLSVRGKWSKWLYAGDCSKSCAGGHKISFRRCIAPPCEGKSLRLETSQKCNTHPCPSDMPGTNDCFTGRGATYSGKISQTISGEQCRLWVDKIFHVFLMPNTVIPEGTPRLDKNYCRNPMPAIYRGPWCIIGIGQGANKWEYCNIPKCPNEEGEILAVPHNLLHIEREYRPCIFPYLGADNKIHNKCKPINLLDPKHAMSYCGFGVPWDFSERYAYPIEPQRHTNLEAMRRESKKIQTAVFQGLESGKYGICPFATKGSWSAWGEKEICSVPCGGGVFIKIRQCLYPPCSGSKTMRSNKSKCNEHDCPLCLHGSGQFYRGNVNTDFRGNRCKKWSSVNRDFTEFHPENYPELKERFCRNPGGVYPIPWCFKEVSNERTLIRAYCDIPHCLDKNLKTIPFTIPDTRYTKYDQTGKPCMFPYLYQGNWYNFCFKQIYTSRDYYCFVKPLKGNVRRLALCPPHYKGKWSLGTFSTCSRPCGGGNKLFVRECLYPPCKGNRFTFEGECNTHKCTWTNNLQPNKDCFIGNGIAYVGNAHTTLSGSLCLPWSPSADRHRYFYSGQNLRHALCRNPTPGGHRFAPWCYINSYSKGHNWEYCDVIKCPKYEGAIMTLTGPGGNRPCFFPFVTMNAEHETCQGMTRTVLAGGKPFEQHLYYCATAKTRDVNPHESGSKDWGFCPPSYKGTLSAWALVRDSNICSKHCGGGKLVYRRKCRFPPCDANAAMIKLKGSCNTRRCNDTCLTGRGESYRGTYTYQGIEKCGQWKLFNLSSFEKAYTLKDLGHNYCRNIAPSRYFKPFCIISQNTIAVCDLPYCVNEGYRVHTVGYNTDGRICHFPFHLGGRQVDTCFVLDSSAPSEYYCGIALGTRDVVSEGLTAKCSKHQIGTWSTWIPTQRCSQYCGTGLQFHRRVCRYAPCRGLTGKYEGVGPCNRSPCDKTRNCYDASTKGVEFRGSSAYYARGHRCVPNHGSDCFTNFALLPSLARPVCLVQVKGSSHLLKRFCNVEHCPGSADGPIMVWPLRDEEERPFSPCIFPFLYKGKVYHECVSELKVRPPTAIGNRPRESYYWCATLYDLRYDLKEWGFCLAADQGRWGKWSEKKCATFCLLLQFRHCLFPPCTGKNWRVNLERCRHSKCNQYRYQWTHWTEWTKCKKCSKVKLRYRYCNDFSNPSKKKSLSTTKFCQGNAADVEVCEVSLTKKKCETCFVYGQSEVKEVIKLIQRYGQRKMLGSIANPLNKQEMPKLIYLIVSVTALYVAW